MLAWAADAALMPPVALVWREVEPPVFGGDPDGCSAAIYGLGRVVARRSALGCGAAWCDAVYCTVGTA